jgi:MFS superfamily sulfate permease-like transporter
MGVVFAGLLSLLQVIYWSSRPTFILLGKVGIAWRNVDNYSQAVQVPGALIVRMDAPRLSFYNISWFREGLENMELRLRE